jgi:hypothetical protein
MGGAALITILGIVERLFRRTISLRLYSSIMLLFVFYASFLTWQEERNNVRSLEAAKTKLDSLLVERDKEVRELSSKLRDANLARPVEVKITGSKSPGLSPLQERLLELMLRYQKQFAATKLVINRKTGALHFDNEPQKGAGVSLIKELYGSENPQKVSEFEKLMESMPSEYVRFLAEGRLDNPFVATVTDEAVRYLRTK